MRTTIILNPGVFVQQDQVVVGERGEGEAELLREVARSAAVDEVGRHVGEEAGDRLVATVVGDLTVPLLGGGGGQDVGDNCDLVGIVKFELKVMMSMTEATLNTERKLMII